MSTSMFSVGLDVHKDSVTIAVFRDPLDPEPMRVDRLPTITRSCAGTASASPPRDPSAPAMRPPAQGTCFNAPSPTGAVPVSSPLPL
jgi:hypothetical protein